jgi:hypothetical protein
MGVIGRAELVFKDDHSSADVTGENVSGVDGHPRECEASRGARQMRLHPWPAGHVRRRPSKIVAVPHDLTCKARRSQCVMFIALTSRLSVRLSLRPVLHSRGARSGERQTGCWREPDSNPRSPHRGEPFRDRAGTWSFGVPGCFLNTQTDSAENGPRDPEL